MNIRPIGIILNGVTGRMGTNQHLERSILAIIQQGGLTISPDLTLMPDPILTGRSADKLNALAEKLSSSGVRFNVSTDLEHTLRDPRYHIFFDSSTTFHRAAFLEQAIAHGKAIYCEKPTAISTSEALRLANLCEKAGLKNGCVQDKLWLPGIQKLAALKADGFFGKILSVRGEFGYWIFTGQNGEQPAQRPSWNYRQEDGGGVIIDMFCHYRYLIDHLFGNVNAVSCLGATHMPSRNREDGTAYSCTADDAAYATFMTDSGIICHINSLWTVRPRRDDLLSLHVDGTQGSAVAGLRSCFTQTAAQTPRAVWNPDLPSPINHFAGWSEVPDAGPYDNAFKIQWEHFLRHVAVDAPFRWTLREAAKGVQLAEAGLQSWAERRWIDLAAI